MEGRLLLSTIGTQGHLRHPAPLVRSVTHRLALSGRLSGGIDVTTQDGQNFLITVTLAGSSGNSRVGSVTIQSSAATNLAFLSAIGSKTSTLSNVPLELTAPGGTVAANGKLTINRSRSQSRIPFLLTAKITGGTGSFAGATGSYRLQGNFNPLAGNSLSVQLRGAIITHT